ncbi:hypothetical protein B0H14DRAFT_3491394 [Mycena olivaceomarginata]|nr:hypothetical protein B0H14DRAFT_3491394 [Mycena olivaceomarginata]
MDLNGIPPPYSMQDLFLATPEERPPAYRRLPLYEDIVRDVGQLGEAMGVAESPMAQNNDIGSSIYTIFFLSCAATHHHRNLSFAPTPAPPQPEQVFPALPPTPTQTLEDVAPTRLAAIAVAVVGMSAAGAPAAVAAPGTSKTRMTHSGGGTRAAAATTVVAEAMALCAVRPAITLSRAAEATSKTTTPTRATAPVPRVAARPELWWWEWRAQRAAAHAPRRRWAAVAGETIRTAVVFVVGRFVQWRGWEPVSADPTQRDAHVFVECCVRAPQSAPRSCTFAHRERTAPSDACTPLPPCAGDAYGARSSRETHIMRAFLIPISIHPHALLLLFLDAADEVSGWRRVDTDVPPSSSLPSSSLPAPPPAPLPHPTPHARLRRGRFRVGEGEFAIPPGFHGMDQAYYFPGDSPPPFSNAAFIDAFAQSFTSFIINLDPNITTAVDGLPVVHAIETSDALLERCLFWDSVGSLTVQ